MSRISLIIGIVCLFLAAIAAGQDSSRIVGKYDPSIQKQEYINAWNRFNGQFQNNWKVVWNEKTAAPRTIYGHTITIPELLTEDNVDNMARRLINEYHYLLKIDTSHLILVQAQFQRSKRPDGGAGTWHINYRQFHQGVPVYGGAIRIVIRDQKLSKIVSDYFPGIDLSTFPQISENQAHEIIRRDMGVDDTYQPIESGLFTYPRMIGGVIHYHLAWIVTMPVVHQAGAYPVEKIGKDDTGELSRQVLPVQWQYFLDAASGEIIERVNVMDIEDLSGTVTGLVHMTIPADPPVTNPIGNMVVKASQAGIDYTTTTDETGQYLFSLPSGDPADIEAFLEGTHANVHNNETGVDAEHNAAAVVVPGTHDWDWDADDPSPEDVETNVYYHLNNIYTWFLRDAPTGPFNVIPTPYPMPAYVRDGAYCNAGAGTSGLSFGSGTASCEDFALCADIIYHEATHRIVHSVYTTYGPGYLPYNPYTGAMNEAWSDYYGATLTDNPDHGGGCYGGRNIDTPDMRYPDDWSGGYHDDGLLFSGANWDLRTALGADYVDGLVLMGMKEAPLDFFDYLGAIIEIDDDPAFSTDPSANNNVADGTPNISDICHCFYDIHGITHSYCVGYTDDPIANIELPSPIEINYFKSSHTVSIEGTAAGSATNALDHFVVEYASADAPGTWLTAGVTLTGGGTSEVIGGVLATWSLAAIADGEYTIRLTAEDIGANTATGETSIIVDSRMLDGWPLYTDEYFEASPAYGDIDPSTPELEIVVAFGYYVYVFHYDGTPVTGWPQNAGGYAYKSSPVVADLDGDGDVEIVLSSKSTLRSWDHDGTLTVSLIYGGSGWNYSYSSPAVWDLDNDGDLEIIAGSLDNNIYIVHHDGTAFTSGVFTWPMTVGGAVYASPAVADIDGDGEAEIIVGSEDGFFYAWNLDGTNAPGAWPINIGQFIWSSAAIGDIDFDADHDLEIVAASNDGNVYAWEDDGSVVAGWPVAITASGNEIYASPALADIDGDDDLEIFINGYFDDLNAFEHDGTVVAGWAPASPATYIANSPIIGDLDGDDLPEIVIGDYSSGANLYAFHPDGSLLTGFPKTTISEFISGAGLIADLDMDGFPELITGNKGVYAWELPDAYNRYAQDWPTFQHDMHRTGYYGNSLPGVVLLFDVSGSMSWSHEGVPGVPPELQRLTFAKNAAIPFVTMLNDFNSGNANFGIADFPPQPWFYGIGCNGQIITPMTLITDVSETDVTTVTIPNLTADGDTPLLAGMYTATSILGVEVDKVIILLSDGYHNCPYSVSAGDPELVTLIDRLNAEGIRVFTIGFARPTDVDHPLLEALATQTTPPGFAGSQFYDVTEPAFDPATWNPATELQITYKGILVDALNLESASDPRGIIAAGTSKSFNIQINEYDNKVCFFIGWANSTGPGLQVTVRSSDGLDVPTGDIDVSYHEGDAYKILTINRPYLERPGKVGSSPWELIINADSLEAGTSDYYQYSVICDSDLKMKVTTSKVAYDTGDDIVLMAKLTENGTPITGLTNVYVEVVGPNDGIGNWYAENIITVSELARIPEKIENESLSALQRKGIYLNDIQKVKQPGNMAPSTIALHDDGTNGDITANDGEYACKLTNIQYEGSHSFHLYATGNTAGGNPFARDKKLVRVVSVKPEPKFILTEVFEMGLVDEKMNKFVVKITPKDKFGNFMGPGQSGQLKVWTSHGTLSNKPLDNLDGSYSQTILVPSSIKGNNVLVKVEVKGATMDFPLSDKTDFEISFHAGLTIPAGTLKNNYDPSFSGEFDFGYKIREDLSAMAWIGYHGFKHKSMSSLDSHWWNFAVGAKYDWIVGTINTFVRAGIGIYLPDNGSTEAGIHSGIGVRYPFTNSISVEGQIVYHHKFTNPDTKYFIMYAGVVYGF